MKSKVLTSKSSAKIRPFQIHEAGCSKVIDTLRLACFIDLVSTDDCLGGTASLGPNWPTIWYTHPLGSSSPQQSFRASARRQALVSRCLQRSLKKAVALAGICKPVSVHTLRFICHALATGGHRHPDGAGVARPFGCQHHDDLHACAQDGGGRRNQSIGCAR